MKRSRFSEEQIIGILKEHQAGLGTKELCRKHGNEADQKLVQWTNFPRNDATFYRWQSKYGGMEVSDARRLKTLESENAKLKTMLAEQMKDVATLNEMLGKMYGPPRGCKLLDDIFGLRECIRPLICG